MSEVIKCLSSPVSTSFLLFKNQDGKLDADGFFIIFSIDLICYGDK